MKLKISVLLTILFSISATVFGQKEAVKPAVETKPKVDVKTPEIKTTAVKMPTVQEILAKYVQAIGGKEANEKIKSRMIKGTLELMSSGIKGTFEIFSAAPNKSIMKISLDGIGEIIEGFDGIAAWSINPLQGNRDKQGEELAQTKLTYDFYRETNLSKLYPKMELKGTEKIGANEAYVVVGTPDNLPSETFYFDTKSGFLLRYDLIAISPEGKMPTKTFFEDMREVDGVKIPFKIRSILPQLEFSITATEVKHHITVEDSKFTKPKV
ncbi:MAG: hypothetical protein H0X72_21040 [Acidobacteria bacterium]|jgi:hypothetical protein|nr:hypothetical protein [Acidobacteriota bacterium]